ncbi:hypothetical protein LZ30DRAFT_740772 [Colletotrichum cereale]|nr:hypothetical protein LZ30DRAFT_740772 [Colletotrichum cereale]
MVPVAKGSTCGRRESNSPNRTSTRRRHAATRPGTDRPSPPLGGMLNPVPPRPFTPSRSLQTQCRPPIDWSCPPRAPSSCVPTGLSFVPQRARSGGGGVLDEYDCLMCLEPADGREKRSPPILSPLSSGSPIHKTNPGRSFHYTGERCRFFTNRLTLLRIHFRLPLPLILQKHWVLHGAPGRGRAWRGETHRCPAHWAGPGTKKVLVVGFSLPLYLSHFPYRVVVFICVRTLFGLWLFLHAGHSAP